MAVYTQPVQTLPLGTRLSPSGARVMLLGAGELGKEVLIALQRLGVETIAVDRYEHAPGQQVAHHARTIAMSDPEQLRPLIEAEQPDALLDRLGLQALRAEATADQGPATFDAAQFAALLKTMEQTEGADVLSAPRVLTANGRAAQVSVVQTHADGTVTGPVVNLTPTLDASGTSVRLEVNLELSFPSPVRP